MPEKSSFVVEGTILIEPSPVSTSKLTIYSVARFPVFTGIPVFKVPSGFFRFFCPPFSLLCLAEHFGVKFVKIGLLLSELGVLWPEQLQYTSFERI